MKNSVTIGVVALALAACGENLPTLRRRVAELEEMEEEYGNN
jgi:hypothetical protein